MAAPTTPAITPADILPKTPDESSVPPASEAVSDSEATIPDDVLAIPAMYGLLRGAPAAISVPIGFKSPETALIGKHAQDLVNAGMGFYDSEDKSTRVMFNEAYVNAKQLADADKAGKLNQIVVPLEAVNAEVSGEEAGASGGASVAPVASAPGTPPAASAQRKLNTQRVKNLQLGSPTSGPAPGAGRILNNILKPTV
jgi:hypothetical protein